MMTIVQKYPLPTGYLFVGNYEKGQLETLSIGDYGKHHNVKADFLGYTRELNGVENTHCMPLSEKWVITLSTQYGCRMKCTFCDVPNVQWHGNVTFNDLKNQLYNAFSLFPDVHYTERLNIHFARMGEPIFNNAVFEFATWMYDCKSQIFDETGIRIETLHPVLTTSLPRAFRRLEERILKWCDIKNHFYNGQAGLQFSINSTNEEQRNEMFSGMSITLEELSKIATRMDPPTSRKYCLNFAYSTDFEIDANKLVSLFSPDKFMVKITPIHNNNACSENNIKTIDGYNSFHPYKQAEEDLKRVGFDVLVFVPSIDEEDGLVTCGNAILGGSELKLTDNTIKIMGV
jgi:23S rRNA (adenine2503-C2)-methyltransferase